MSYEVRDDGMWRVVDVFGTGDGVEYAGTVADAVSDALDVLRAAGWKTTVHQRNQDEERTVARSPWREVGTG